MNCPPFMEHERSLLHLQEPAAGSISESGNPVHASYILCRFHSQAELGDVSVCIPEIYAYDSARCRLTTPMDVCLARPVGTRVTALNNDKLVIPFGARFSSRCVSPPQQNSAKG
jgi:hypothetical protein